MMRELYKNMIQMLFILSREGSNSHDLLPSKSVLIGNWDESVSVVAIVKITLTDVTVEYNDGKQIVMPREEVISSLEHGLGMTSAEVLRGEELDITSW